MTVDGKTGNYKTKAGRFSLRCDVNEVMLDYIYIVNKICVLFDRYNWHRCTVPKCLYFQVLSNLIKLKLGLKYNEFESLDWVSTRYKVQINTSILVIDSFLNYGDHFSIHVKAVTFSCKTLKAKSSFKAKDVELNM